MDDPDLDPKQHQKALAGLRRINATTQSYRPLWNAMRPLAAELNRPLRVLDVAAGGGDSLIAIGKYACKANIPVQLTGLDISPTAVKLGQQACDKQGIAAEFVEGNAISGSLPGPQDVIYCSLFLHHLEQQDAQTLLESMTRHAEKLALVSDLIRSRFGYAYAVVGTRLLSRSHIVHIDGPRSVESAFSVEEIRHLADASGMESAKITRFWPERFLLQWSRDQASQAGSDS